MTKLSDTSEDSIVKAVADRLQRDGGTMDNAWNMSELIPVMIMYCSGFEAYASAIRAQVPPHPSNPLES
jgi:hypothetical protein